MATGLLHVTHGQFSEYFSLPAFVLPNCKQNYIIECAKSADKVLSIFVCTVWYKSFHLSDIHTLPTIPAKTGNCCVIIYPSCCCDKSNRYIIDSTISSV